MSCTPSPDDGSGEATLWLLADDRLSWASVDYAPGVDAYDVEQYGPRRLWDEGEAAWQWWDENGQPARDRFALTIDAGGQRVRLENAE